MTRSVAIISSAHDLSDVRTHRWTRALQDAGCEVTLYMRGDPDGAPMGAICANSSGHSGFKARLLDDLRLPWRVKEPVWIVLDPDLLLSCLPVAFLRRRKVVADVHEDYEQVARDRPWATGWKQPIVRLGCRLATYASSRSALTTVADDHVPPRKARKRMVLPNRPAIEHLPKVHAHGDKLRAVYVGDIRASRGSLTMLSTISAAPDWHLDLIGPISPSHRSELEAKFPAEVFSRITFHGRQAPNRTWEIVAGAQVGLAMLNDTPAYREALPTKVVEYHAAGLALIVTPLPRMIAVIEESEAGVVANSTDEAAEVLNGWAADRTELTEHGTSARSWTVENFSHEDPFDRAAAAVIEL